MLLHNAVASICCGVFGHSDCASHFDITHVVGGVVYREASAWIASYVVQLLFTCSCRKQNVVTVEQEPYWRALRTSIGKQSGEDSGVWAFENGEELLVVDRTGAHGFQTNRTWLLPRCSALKTIDPLVGC